MRRLLRRCDRHGATADPDAATVAEDGALEALDPAPRIGDELADWEAPLALVRSGRPAVAADGGTAGELEVLAAASAGLEHRQAGAGCQDAYALCPIATGLVVCIADGVGSAALSALGAATASAAAAACCAELEPGADVAEAIHAAHAAIVRAAAERGVDPRELATTLLVARVEATADAVAVEVAAVGDSSAFAMRSPSEMRRVAGPEALGGAELSTSLPLTPRMAIERAASELEPGALLVLATDGLADDLVASPRVREWCWRCWTEADTPLRAANALDYRRQGTSDDLAAAVVRRRR